MDAALVVARLLLAAVFAAAGAAKLADLAGSRQALAGFGVPQRLARPLGTLLPFAELAVAGLLLFSSTARAGAVGALSLLGLFAVGIAVSMARGRAPDCHCFGQLHSEPAGAKALVRNLVLAGVAGFVVFAGSSAGPGVSEAVAELDGAEWLAVAGALLFLVAMAGAAAAAVGLMRQNGRLLLRLEGVEAALRTHGIDIPDPQTTQGPPPGLPVGEPAPDFSLPGLHGETVTLSSLRAGAKPVVLVFTDPNCEPCRLLMPRLGEWQGSRAGDLTLAVISRGASDAMRVEASEHGLQTLLVDEGDRVSDAYRARLTPCAVLIDDEGRIAAPVVAGNDAIASLVQTAGAPALEVVPGGGPTITEGDELPEIDVRSLDGGELALADALGDRERTILFWDPGCGFCQRMLADLRSLESERPEVTRSLLVVSQGTSQANREQGLNSDVVIERDSFALADAVGAPGTPAALRVDGDGRMASSVALGAEAVLDLVRAAAPTDV